MKIENSTIQLASQHSQVDKRTVNESLKMWLGERPNFEGDPARAQTGTKVTLSAQAQAQAAGQRSAVDNSTVVDSEKNLENDPRYLLVKLMFEKITGMKMEVSQFKLNDVAPPDIPTPAQANIGVEYDRHETHYESEQTSFSADGMVKTSDGKAIAFHLDLNMSREHLEQAEASLHLGKAKDPLVINFDGKTVQLGDQKFSFDLNADGSPENISFVSSGSGFLALDKNGDGKINDGSELFGPATNNGFSELAAYDQDGNHWIDENDAAYQALRVWSKDADGKDTLSTLAEKKVGAISLANISTSFDLKNSQNQLDGTIRKSAAYLSEDGAAGTVQQIDLVV